MINVKAPPYNAYGDGTHDDTAAIQAALDSAFSSIPHKAVYVPSGRYLVTGLTVSANDGVHIYGSGASVGPGYSTDQTTLYCTTTGATILSLTANGPGTTGRRVHIHDLSIVGDTGTNISGLAITDYAMMDLDNLVIGSTGTALKMAGCANFSISSVWAQNNSGSSGHHGLALIKDPAGVACGPGAVQGGQFESLNGSADVGAAVYDDSGFSIGFHGTQFVGITSGLVSVVELNLDSLSFYDCYSESCCNTTADTAVLFRLGNTGGCRSFALHGGHFYSGNGGGHNLQDGIRVMGNGVYDMIVTNSIWASTTRSGIYFVLDPVSIVKAGTFLGNYSSGTANPPVFQSGAGTVPSGGNVNAYFTNSTIPLTDAANGWTANNTFFSNTGFHGNIEITDTTGTYVTGSIYRTPSVGLAIAGVAGSSYDWVLYNGSGTPVIKNPTGTPDAVFQGSISAATVVIPSHTPANSSEAGTAGQICQDSSYLYVWTAAGTNKRIPLTAY